MIAGAVTPTALLPEGVVQFYAARDLTPGSVFNVAVLEKPKLKYVERSAKTFLSAMQQIASGGSLHLSAERGVLGSAAGRRQLISGSAPLYPRNQ